MKDISICTRSLGGQFTAVALVYLMVLAPLAQARFQPTSGFDLFSTQQEIQAGQQASAEVHKQLPLVPDSNPVAQYVQRMGAKLAAHAPGNKWPYNFHVVAQSDINAFAMPGGPIYVNLGTIQTAENEAELAGVMSHEISHVVQRHSTRAATQQMMVQAPLALLGGFMGRGLGSQLAALGISFGLNSYFLKNSRTDEKQADLLGTDIMYDSGYDPHNMARFFEIIKQKYPSRAPQFLSDHPDPGNRIEYVDKEIATLPAKSYVNDSPEFQRIRKIALGMKAYSAQEIAQMQKAGTLQNANAASAGNAAAPVQLASPQLKEFQHNAYTIQYPENWNVYGDVTSAVTIAPAAGVSQNAVTYGAIISGFQPENPASLDQATHELVTELKQGNPQLREIGNDSDIKVNGLDAKSVQMIGVSPLKNAQGAADRERDWLVVLPASDHQHMIYAVFISPEQDYSQLQPAFENMLRTLHVR